METFLIPDSPSDSSSGEDLEFIWAQCEYEKCQKWRKLDKEVFEKEERQTEKWFCEMNPDTQYNECSKPEERWKMENYKYNQKLILHTVILAKNRTYAKWPAIISLCPVKNKYTIKKNSMYNVEFFGTHSHSWVDVNNIEMMDLATELEISQKHKQYQMLLLALKEAKEALVVKFSDRANLIKFKPVEATKTRKHETKNLEKCDNNQFRSNKSMLTSNEDNIGEMIPNQQVFKDFNELHTFGISLLDQMQDLLTRLRLPKQI